MTGRERVMKLETLMAKVEAANQVSTMCGLGCLFYVYVDIDGLAVSSPDDYSTHFKSWKKLIEAIKYDWTENVVKAIEEGQLVYGGEPYGGIMPFSIETEAAKIRIEVDYVR